MATLIDRIPDDKHLRLKELAESQGVSVNKPIAKGTTCEAIEELLFRKVCFNEESIGCMNFQQCKTPKVQNKQSLLIIGKV
jgi:hypothetical protein